MFVCCECCALSGRGLCDELIARPEESYRLCCVVVCDLENLVNEEALAHCGLLRQKQNKKNSVALVRERTIPTERPPPVGEVSANFCG